jgi:hypothetical protein
MQVVSTVGHRQGFERENDVEHDVTFINPYAREILERQEG